VENLRNSVLKGVLLEKYVGKMDEACGEGKEFIVTLRHDKVNEAISRVLEKVSVEHSVAGMLTKAKYKDKQVDIFRNGKLVIREFHGREEAESFLGELLE